MNTYINRQIKQGGGSTYNEIHHIIINSIDYQKLMEDITELKEDLQGDLSDQKRLKKSDKLSEKEQQLEAMKKAVYDLYENFNRKPINSERLRKAKDYFEKGEFREADAILKQEDIASEVLTLKIDEKNKESELLSIRQSLNDKANEYLIKAQLWKAFYQEPVWFENTCNYFECALDADRTHEIVFEYAHFLQEHQQFNKAQDYYEEALGIYRDLAQENPRTYLSDVAMTLNNLANLHQAKNEFDKALGCYEEALGIYRDLAQENPRTYLSDVAMTLNNLAILHKAKNEFDKALGCYEEALGIYRDLAQENPRTYRSYVATTLNNLAILHKAKNEFDKALGCYEEALGIYRDLAQENPEAYLPDLSSTIINLSIYYLQAAPDQEKSISLAMESVSILLPLYNKLPLAAQYLQTALEVLKANRIDLNQLFSNKEIE